MSGSSPTKIEIGMSGEAQAVEVLLAHGYQIVERNFRLKSGELDIIARDGDVLVFVEVRSRGDDRHGEAAEMVGRTKQRRVARLAELYIGIREPAFEEARFDVVAITGGHAELIRDAFRA